MRWLVVASLVILPFAAGCGGDDSSGTEETACDGASVTTWETFGKPFLTTYCQGCHASTSPERAGAPSDVIFDTAEDAFAWKDRILARAGSEPPTMPAQGGTSAEDRERLRVWITCFDGH